MLKSLISSQNLAVKLVWECVRLYGELMQWLIRQLWMPAELQLAFSAVDWIDLSNTWRLVEIIEKNGAVISSFLPYPPLNTIRPQPNNCRFNLGTFN